MIEAIRNIGILKMIDKFEDFDFNALESVKSFLAQRKKAIRNRVYAQLQFEPISTDRIGIFVMDNGKIRLYLSYFFSPRKIKSCLWEIIHKRLKKCIVGGKF